MQCQTADGSGLHPSLSEKRPETQWNLKVIESDMCDPSIAGTYL
jgi:hypothetical protein